MLYVSVHIPKTAGTSFARSLKESFSEAALSTDYHHARDFKRLAETGVQAADIHRDWLSPNLLRLAWRYHADLLSLPKTVRLVHGHFPARKYHPLLTLRKPCYITWIRDPFARAVSNFFYWQTCNPDTDPDPLVRTVLSERWDLEKFLFHPALKDYQSLFLRGVPWHRINFIGVTEFFEEDLERLSKKIGCRLTPYGENVGPVRNAVETHAHLRDRFEAFHKSDSELYRYALERRRKDMARDGVPI